MNKHSRRRFIGQLFAASIGATAFNRTAGSATGHLNDGLAELCVMASYDSLPALERLGREEIRVKVGQYLKTLSSAGHRDADELTYYGLAYLLTSRAREADNNRNSGASGFAELLARIADNGVRTIIVERANRPRSHGPGSRQAPLQSSNRRSPQARERVLSGLTTGGMITFPLPLGSPRNLKQRLRC